MAGRTWKKLSSKQIMKIKELLIRNGKEDLHTGISEEWRIRIDRAVFTAYKNGTLYWNGGSYNNIQTIIEEINKIAGSQFKSTNKKILLGFDEVGRGEVIGSLITVGVRYPSSLNKAIENIISMADTKKRKSNEYWYEIYKKIRRFKDKGLSYTIEKIEASDIDNNNINELLDKSYCKIIERFMPDQECSIVIDNYGIKEELNYLLDRLARKGVEIYKEHQADDRYLEVKLASIIAKVMKIRELEMISKIIGSDVGSGNINDIKTINSLPIIEKIEADIIRHRFLKNKTSI